MKKKTILIGIGTGLILCLSAITAYSTDKNSSFSTPPQPEAMMFGQGAPFPVNEIIFSLPEGEPRSAAEELAALVGGDIVSFSASINLYKIRVPTNTVEELQELIDILSADPRVDDVFRNIQATPF